MEKVYILEVEDLTDGLARMFGVYSSEDLAESDIPEHDESEFKYYITEVEVDVSFDEQFDLTDETSEVTMELMQEGLVDQFVDENGNFVYELTEKGNKLLE
jgi:hypothetical protein